MAFVAIGALVGAISVGGAYLFGATLVASMLTGAMIGSLFESTKLGIDNSPTYSFGPLQNTKTQVLPIPVVYGKCRVGGNIFYEKFLDEDKIKVNRYVGISEGPIESITDVRANDLNLATENLEGCSFTVHLNTTPGTFESRDPEGDRPYPDDIAFIATTLKAQQKLSGMATLSCIVEGRQVWTPSGVQYTRNPAWIIRDYLTNARYGLGIPEDRIDEGSFLAVANYCDAHVGAGEERFCLDYNIDTYRHGPDVLADMLACFRGFLIKREKIQLRVDAPVASASKAIGEDSIIEGSFTWWQNPDEDVLNRVIVEWIDPDNHWERTTTFFEDPADIAIRGVVERTFSLLGITRPSQVARMGAYLIDCAQGIRNFCSFNLSLKDADIEVGDVIALTHDLPGWSGKWMRVLNVTDTGDSEEITVVCAEYVAEVYNDTALDIPGHIDTNLPNPYVCPNVTNLDAVEFIQVHPDGPVMSNIDVTWQDPPVLLSGVEIALLEEGASVWEVLAVVPEGTEGYVIRNVRANQTVSVRVRAINEKGIKASGVTKGLTLYGKAAPPGPPVGLLANGGYTYMDLSWTNPTDPDLSHIEIVEYTGAAEPSDPSEGSLVAIVDTNRYVRVGLENLTSYWYWVRAVDTSGNTSDWVGPVNGVTADSIDLEIPEGGWTVTDIADGAITTPKLNTNAVTADKIAANAVTAGKINVSSLSAIKADLGIVTAGIAKSTDNKFIIDLTNRTLEIYDDVVSVQVLTGASATGNIKVTLNPGTGNEDITIAVENGMTTSEVAEEVAEKVTLEDGWRAYADDDTVIIRHDSGETFTFTFSDLGSTGVTVDDNTDQVIRVKLGYLGA